MTETIRCPGCSTRFALRPERVHARMRRARCFRCETVFGIEDAVARLLGPGAAAPPAPEPPQAPPPVPAASSESTVELHVAPPAEAAPEAVLPPPVPVQAAPPAPPFEPVEPPSLTLGDLEGAEDEIMEKTLVILPPPPPGAPEPEEATAPGGFSSAKDAIAKLMGDAPAAAPGQERRQLGARGPMDVEATLSALEDTLGGNQVLPPPPPPVPAPQEPAASTLKLSAQEIQAAMASLGAQRPAPPAPRPPLPPPPRAAVPPPPRPPEPPSASQGADLLKIQVEQEVLSNVTIDQITTWIEQGRVHEYHMVARQFSDHWIEASKVPALRPIFDRIRREGGMSADFPSAPPELAPARKSLFGGLFGRN